MLAFASAFAPGARLAGARARGFRGGARACSSSANGTGDGAPPAAGDFTIVSQERLFHRYQSVYARTVRYPTGQTVSYDVVGHARSDFTSVFVFPYHTRTRTATLLREYSPGRNRVAPAFVAGMFERARHASLEDAARAEMSEEALLKGGTLLRLARDGVAADKYSLNEFHYFLALDAHQDKRPGQRDEEEWISVQQGVPLDEVRGMVQRGELNTPHALLAMLALARLRELGLD